MFGSAYSAPRSELRAGLAALGFGPEDAEELWRLARLLVDLPEPRTLMAVFPDLSRLRDRLAQALDGDDADALEARLLDLYAHLHMNDGWYTPEERGRLDAAGGYWNHAGGLSPILKARPWIDAATVSADFGAGNGLQGLLLQALHPHARVDLVEISSRLAETGEGLREWLQIASQRVRWIVGDVCDVPARTYDFIYLYRPVRPEGRGREFYARFARQVESEERPPIIFSVADCLRGFLSTRYRVFYGDGHLTCFRADPQEATA